MLKVIAQLVSQLGAIGGAVIAGLSRRISDAETILPGILTDVGLAGIALASLSGICLTAIAIGESRAEAVERRRIRAMLASLERGLLSEQRRALAALEEAARQGAAPSVTHPLIGAAHTLHASQVKRRIDEVLAGPNREAFGLMPEGAQLAVSRLRQATEHTLDISSQIALKASAGGYSTTVWDRVGRFLLSFLVPFSVAMPRVRGALDDRSL
jgi:hypothetical protein